MQRREGDGDVVYKTNEDALITERTAEHTNTEQWCAWIDRKLDDRLSDYAEYVVGRAAALSLTGCHRSIFRAMGRAAPGRCLMLPRQHRQWAENARRRPG